MNYSYSDWPEVASRCEWKQPPIIPLVVLALVLGAGLLLVLVLILVPRSVKPVADKPAVKPAQPVRPPAPVAVPVIKQEVIPEGPAAQPLPITMAKLSLHGFPEDRIVLRDKGTTIPVAGCPQIDLEFQAIDVASYYVEMIPDPRHSTTRKRLFVGVNITNTKAKIEFEPWDYVPLPVNHRAPWTVGLVLHITDKQGRHYEQSWELRIVQFWHG